MIARGYTEKDYVVALFHLVRVVLVFCSTPLLWLYSGSFSCCAVEFCFASDADFLSLPFWVLSMFLMTALLAICCTALHAFATSARSFMS